MSKAKKPAKPKVGRPAKPPGERTKVITVRLPEDVIAWLGSAGDSPRNAIKALVMAAYNGPRN